jgi:riboflavin synthase
VASDPGEDLQKSTEIALEKEIDVVEVTVEEEEEENPYFKENIEKIEAKKHVYNILNDSSMPKT